MITHIFFIHSIPPENPNQYNYLPQFPNLMQTIASTLISEIVFTSIIILQHHFETKVEQAIWATIMSENTNSDTKQKILISMCLAGKTKNKFNLSSLPASLLSRMPIETGQNLMKPEATPGISEWLMSLLPLHWLMQVSRVQTQRIQPHWGTPTMLLGSLVSCSLNKWSGDNRHRCYYNQNGPWCFPGLKQANHEAGPWSQALSSDNTSAT